MLIKVYLTRMSTPTGLTSTSSKTEYLCATFSFSVDSEGSHVGLRGKTFRRYGPSPRTFWRHYVDGLLCVWEFSLEEADYSINFLDITITPNNTDNNLTPISQSSVNLLTRAALYTVPHSQTSGLSRHDSPPY